MKRALLISGLLLALGAVTLFALCPLSSSCPVDDLEGQWTGETRYIESHPFQVYRCIKNHTWLVRCD